MIALACDHTGVALKQELMKMLDEMERLFLPFVFGSAYSQIFCATIAIALFTYYVFSVLQVTRKDLMTGLLNRSGKCILPCPCCLT